MAFSNRIQVQTSTTGTGTLTLNSTGVRNATNGDCVAPAEDGTLGSRFVSYFITNGNNFAYGKGQLDSTSIYLTRDANEYSWNGSAFSVALLNLSGTSTILITPRALDLGAGSRGRTIALARNIVSL